MRSRFLVKLAVGVGAFFGVAIGGVWILAQTIDVETYRGLMQDTVKRVTGRELKIEGNIDLTILSFRPAIIAEKVSFANASWGSKPNMAEIDRLEAEIALIPLLSGNIDIARLALVGPNILLEQDGKGKANWLFGETGEASPEETAQSAQGTMRLFVGELAIEKARVTYISAKKATPLVLTLNDFSLDSTGPKDPVKIGTSGNLDGKTFKFTATLGPIDTLFAPAGPYASPYDIKLDGQLDQLKLNVDGTMTNLDEGRVLKLQTKAEAADLAAVAKLAGVDLPSVGGLSFSGSVGGTVEKPSLSNVNATIKGAGRPTVTAQGSVGNVMGPTGVTMAVTLNARNMGEIGSVLAIDLAPVEPVSLSGQVTDDRGGWKIANLVAQIGKSDLAGDVSVNVAGARPSIVANLNSKTIDIAQLQGDATPASVNVNSGGPSPTGKVIPDIDLPIAQLSALDLALNWNIARLDNDPLTFENVSLPITIKDGRLNATPAIGGLAGGSLKGTLAVDGIRRPAGVTLNLEGSKIGVIDLMSKMGLVNAFTGGLTDLSANLTGSGSSTGQILATLNGNARIVAGKATLRGARADLMVLDVVRELWPFTNTRDTEVRCVVGQFTVRNGVANVDSFLFDTSRMTVGGEGTINLPTEQLDLVLRPSAKDATLVGVNIALNVRGTLANPSIAPSPAGVVRGIVGAVGGLAISPLTILGSIVSSDESANPCLVAIDQSRSGGAAQQPQRPVTPTPSIPTTPREAEGLIRGIIGR